MHRLLKGWCMSTATATTPGTHTTTRVWPRHIARLVTLLTALAVGKAAASHGRVDVHHWDTSKLLAWLWLHAAQVLLSQPSSPCHKVTVAAQVLSCQWVHLSRIRIQVIAALCQVLVSTLSCPDNTTHTTRPLLT